MRVYLVPRITNGNAAGPKYFASLHGIFTGIECNKGIISYGFMPSCLVVAINITDADHNALILNSDVYCFPDNLDVNIATPQELQPFFEGINVPADWLTPATTYRQLLRNLAGIFLFSIRYAGICLQPLFGAGVTLSTRYRDLTTQQQGWFTQTVQSFGYPSSIINQNATFRQMLKQVGDLFGSFTCGGITF